MEPCEGDVSLVISRGQEPTVTAIPTLVPTATSVPTPEPTETARPTPEPTATARPSPSATSTPQTREITAFSAPDNPTGLASGWGWFPGASAESSYQIADDGALLITAGEGTRPWDYQSPPRAEHLVSGDFTAQVRLEYDTSETTSGGVVLGIRSSANTDILRVYRR